MKMQLFQWVLVLHAWKLNKVEYSASILNESKCSYIWSGWWTEFSSQRRFVIFVFLCTHCFPLFQSHIDVLFKYLWFDLCSFLFMIRNGQIYTSFWQCSMHDELHVAWSCIICFCCSIVGVLSFFFVVIHSYEDLCQL